MLNNTLAKVFQKDKTKTFEEQSWAYKLVAAVTKIVKYFKSSALAKQFRPVLKSNVCTRWNSICNMLESVIHHWERINQILRSSGKHIDDLNSISLHELEILKDFCLQFKKSTDDLEGSKHPTLCNVIPNYLRICNHLEVKSSDPNCIVECKRTALKYWMENVQKNLTIYHGLAIFLHPLTKHLKTQKPHEKTEIWTRTLTLMNEYMPSTCTQQKQPRSFTNRTDSALSLCMGDSESEDDQSEAEIELDEYKKIRIRGDDAHNFDLLNWWQAQKDRFPRLYGVARFIHSIPASSAAAERLFSIAGRLVTFRPNIRSGLVDEMLFLKSNHDLSRQLQNQYEYTDNDAIETISLDCEESNEGEVVEVLVDWECHS